MPGTTDTVKTILTPGEFVVRKEAVDMIGVPMLNMINNMPEKGGHSNIDKLIEMATTENMKGMYGGGMVNAGPKPMGHGGMVDAYRGGGMVMDQYGHGGMVKNKMMSYGHGGMVKDKMMMMEKGGQLKPVPEDNPGLGKLPEMVRNRMGYMQDGGEVALGYENGGKVQELMEALQQAELEPMMNPFTGEELGEAAVNPKTGRLPTDAYRTMNKINRLGNPYLDIVSALERKESKEPERGILDMLIGRKTNYIDELEKRILDNPESYKVRESYREDDNWGDYSTGGGNTIGEMLGGRLLFGLPSGEVEVSDYRKNRLRELMGMRYGGMAKKKKKMMGYQEGGPVEEGIPLPPQPKDPLQIGLRQQNPSMYEGSTLGAVMDQAMMLEDSIEQDTVNRARKALQLMRLKGMLSDAELLDSPTGNPVLDREQQIRDIQLREMFGNLPK